MLSAVDPLGRTVHLTADRWEHIIDGHPEMGSLRGEVLRAIREPSELLRAPCEWARTGTTCRAQALRNGSRW